jgi:hypothetical protein
MSRYSSYGRLDDQVLQDIDLGFAGFNDRLRPDQLLPGMLEKCENARLDRNGEWKLRPGYDLQLAPFAVGDTALKLPFNVFANKTITDSNHARVDNTTFRLTETNHGLSVGTIVDVSGLSVSGGTAPNGTFKVKAVPDANNFDLAVTNLTVEPTNSATVISPSLRDGDINVVYGSCSFIDPNTIDNEGYIILAGNTKAIAVKTSDPTTKYDLTYPNGQTVEDTCDVIQAFNKIYIFRKGGSTGKIAFVLDTAENAISTQPTFSLASNGSYTQPQVITTAAKDNALVDEVFTVCTLTAFREGQQVTCLDQTGTGLYQSLGNTSETSRDPNLSKFTVKEVFEASTTTVTVNAVSISSTTVTIGCDAAHGLKVHQPIELKDLDTELNGKQVVAKLGQADGTNTTTKFQVEVASTFSVSDTAGTVEPASGFSFLTRDDQRVEIKTQAQVRAATPKFQRKLPSSLGYIHMPTPNFGTLHQGRLIVPYQYDPENNNNSRKIYDEIIASDILDSDTYDRIFGSFRFNAGTSDFTIGITSFSEDSLLVFNKNSIHRVTGTTNPTTATAQVLTEEIGALARKSIIQVGKNVFFLSDNGVYSLEFLDEYNLRGTQTPLSEPIAKTMDRLFNTESKDHADKSVGLYFNNRYYLAVPFDGNDYNSHLLIYNFLNNNWESIDAPTTDGKFEYTNLLLSNDEVYAVNTDGGIHKVDGNQIGFSNTSIQGKDTIVTQIEASSQETPIDGVLKTRMYTMSDIGRKKFREFHLSAEGGDSIPSDMTIKLQTENVDLELSASQSNLGTIQSYLGKTIPAEEDINIRGRIGNRRAYGAQFQLENTEGSPKVKNIKVTATKTFNSLNPTE